MALDKVKGLCTDAEIDIRIISGLLCGSATAILMLKWVNQRRVQKKLEEAKKKRELGFQRMEKAAKQFKQQNPGVKAAPVLSLPLVELAAKLRDGSLSPESVLYIYTEKALEVTREINCVINYLPECEEQLQEVKKREKGLLYGIPVSIKEDVSCKGYPNTLGLVKFLDHPEREDSVIVKVLKKQGAIPFVRTNTSQAILNIDCGNTLFGQTLNPFNHTKSSGGSSGGEGALIGGGGSILGIGTDVAASIRVPCGFCGICGIKPTGYRLSLEDSSEDSEDELEPLGPEPVLEEPEPLGLDPVMEEPEAGPSSAGAESMAPPEVQQSSLPGAEAVDMQEDLGSVPTFKERRAEREGLRRSRRLYQKRVGNQTQLKAGSLPS